MYVYTTICLSINSWWTLQFSTFWLLRIRVLWIFLCKCLYEHMALILLVIYLGQELLGYVVKLCVTFWGTTILFLKLASPFYISTALHEDSSFSTSSQIFVNSHFLNYSHAIDVKCYLTVIFVFCISLMSDVVEHFFLCLLAIMNCFWRNIYLDPLLILYWLY